MQENRTFESVKLLGEKRLYKKFFEVSEYTFQHPLYNGTMSPPYTREIMERGEATGVLLYDPKLGKIALVEQFRAGVYLAGENPWTLECVAGINEQGQTPEQVARREALEEAGVELMALEPILNYYSSPGGITEKIYLFCAKIDSTQLPEYAGLKTEHEDIKIIQFDEAEIPQLLASNRANNGLIVITLQWFLLNKEQLKEKWGK